MIYLKWTPSELATLPAGALYTEVDEDGWVQRELGVGDDGLITHQLVPSDSRPGGSGSRACRGSCSRATSPRRSSSRCGMRAPCVQAIPDA